MFFFSLIFHDFSKKQFEIHRHDTFTLIITLSSLFTKSFFMIFETAYFLDFQIGVRHETRLGISIAIMNNYEQVSRPHVQSSCLGDRNALAACSCDLGTTKNLVVFHNGSISLLLWLRSSRFWWAFYYPKRPVSVSCRDTPRSALHLSLTVIFVFSPGF